jgi:hypothetical protein
MESGHGMTLFSVRGKNYLLPADFHPSAVVSLI